MSLKKRMLLAVLALPFNAMATVPALILWATGFDRWAEPWATVAEAAGAILLGCALYASFVTLRLFMRVGEGTPAPWDPPQKLVVSGPYRRVRNPMISSVVFALIGEGLVLTSVPLLVWAAVFLLGNLMYVRSVEEPALVERFGDDYVEYRTNVTAWIPRVKPWPGPSSGLRTEPRLPPR